MSSLAFPDDCHRATAGEAAMEEELHEADVLWPETSDHHRSVSCDDGDMACERRRPSVVLAEVDAAVAAELSSPVPVRVPGRRKRRSRSWSSDQSDGSGGGSNDDGGYTDDARRAAANGFGLLPPHVLVDRRRRLGGGRTAAYSMCAGKGRTLKGRDLRNVRNLVLQMTGFIEK